LGKERRPFSSSLCNFLHSHYLVPLRPKYSPQHPILKHPQSTFLLQCHLHVLFHIFLFSSFINSFIFSFFFLAFHISFTIYLHFYICFRFFLSLLI
jgi:hypothetical protein